MSKINIHADPDCRQCEATKRWLTDSLSVAFAATDVHHQQGEPADFGAAVRFGARGEGSSFSAYPIGGGA